MSSSAEHETIRLLREIIDHQREIMAWLRRIERIVNPPPSAPVNTKRRG